LKPQKFPNVALISLGCPKNLVDSEVILGFLHQAGFTITFNETEAEIVVINTCSFIEDAKRESIETILELAEQKKRGPTRLLVVIGCLAQDYGEELRQQIQEIDLVVGTGMIAHIAELCQDALEKKLQKFVWVNEPTFLYTEHTPRMRATFPHVSYVKIAEGCDNQCSYCLIPRLRGKYRSRESASVVAECRELVQQGVREVNLIAQDTTAYGHERHFVQDELVILLQELVKLEGLQWIRLLYTYPDFLSRELLECIAREPKICKYIDVPIQHINDGILRGMNRKSTRKSIEQAINLIQEILPQAVLRTSLMVGFPGEKEKQFEELRAFVDAVKFDRLGVFSFSPQEGTVAAQMKGKISQRVKEQRRDEILQLQAGISLEKNQRRIGTIQEVIIDTLQPKSRDSSSGAIGRTAGHAPDIDGVVYLSGDTLWEVGEIRPVRITGADIYDLFVENIQRYYL